MSCTWWWSNAWTLKFLPLKC